MTRATSACVSWVVGPNDGRSVGAILVKLGDSAVAAVPDGRVFVDGRRAASAADRVRPGDCVQVFAPRPAGGAPEVIAEREGVLAVMKPAGLSAEPDRRGRAGSLTYAVADALGVPPTSLHACTRLDLGVSGVVLLARTAGARRVVVAAQRRGRVVRRYVAIAACPPAEPRGVWTAPLPGRRGRASAARGRSRPAETRFACVATADAATAECRVAAEDARPTLLALEPATGRLHQIRAHASAAGAPLLGDRRYAGPTRVIHKSGQTATLDRIALHAAHVRVGLARGEWRVGAPVPAALIELWNQLGGTSEDFSRALDGGRL